MSVSVNAATNVNARTVVAVRLSASGLAVIDRLAAAAGWTRSQTIRELLAEHLGEAKFRPWLASGANTDAPRVHGSTP